MSRCDESHRGKMTFASATIANGPFTPTGCAQCTTRASFERAVRDVKHSDAGMPNGGPESAADERKKPVGHALRIANSVYNAAVWFSITAIPAVYFADGYATAVIGRSGK